MFWGKTVGLQSSRRLGSSISHFPSHFLILDWEARGIRVTAIQKTRSQYLRRDEFQLDWNDSEDSPRPLGHLIRQELGRRGRRETEVLLSVPRRAVVFKNILVPRLVANETANIVALQCEHLFPVGRESLVIDYVAHPSVDGEEESPVLVAAISKDLLKHISETMREAGLKIRHVGIAELGLALLDADHGQKGTNVEVLIDRMRADFLVSRAGFPLISYSNQTDQGHSLQQISSTVKRLQEASLPFLGSNRIEKVRIRGEEISEWASRVTDEMGLPCELISEPSQEVRDRALIGALSSSQHRIDFQSPKKPRDPRIESRKRAILYAMMAIALVILVGVPLLRDHLQLDKDISATIAKAQKLEENIQRFQSIEPTYRKLVDFQSSKIDLAVELQTLLGQLPSAELLYLESLEVSPSSNNGGLLIRLRGRARDRNTLSSLTNQLLLLTDQYRIRPPSVDPTKGDSDYRFSFTMEVELLKRNVNLAQSPVASGGGAKRR